MSKYAAKKSKQAEQGERVTKAIVAAAKAPKPAVPPRREWAQKRVEVLDARLGVGVGAKRERDRLAKLIGSMVAAPQS